MELIFSSNVKYPLYSIGLIAISFVIAILFVPLPTQASSKKPEPLPSIQEAKFTHYEWDGPEEFIKQFKLTEKNGCPFLTEMEKKYPGEEATFQRSSLIRQKIKCADNYKFAEGNLKSDNSVIITSAIRLAATFDKKEKAKIRPLIEKLKNHSSPLVTGAVKAFK
jgi:hypothetical protein